MIPHFVMPRESGFVGWAKHAVAPEGEGGRAHHLFDNAWWARGLRFAPLA
jgi:hypothetical protein